MMGLKKEKMEMRNSDAEDVEESRVNVDVGTDVMRIENGKIPYL